MGRGTRCTLCFLIGFCRQVLRLDRGFLHNFVWVLIFVVFAGNPLYELYARYFFSIVEKLLQEFLVNVFEYLVVHLRTLVAEVCRRFPEVHSLPIILVHFQMRLAQLENEHD